jgi:hypothetical protein
LVGSKRDGDSRWPSEARWNTPRALRVLHWYSTGG